MHVVYIKRSHGLSFPAAKSGLWGNIIVYLLCVMRLVDTVSLYGTFGCVMTVIALVYTCIVLSRMFEYCRTVIALSYISVHKVQCQTDNRLGDPPSW